MLIRIKRENAGSVTIWKYFENETDLEFEFLRFGISVTLRTW